MGRTVLIAVFAATVIQCYGAVQQVQMPEHAEIHQPDDGDLQAQVRELQRNMTDIWTYIQELRLAVSHHLKHLRQHQEALESSVHKLEHAQEGGSGFHTHDTFHGGSYHHSGEQHSHGGDHSHGDNHGSDHHSHTGEEHSHGGDHSHGDNHGSDHHSHTGEEHSHGGDHSHGDNHGSVHHSHTGEERSHGGDHSQGGDHGSYPHSHTSEHHSHSDEHHSHTSDQHSHSGENHAHTGDQHSHSGEHHSHSGEHHSHTGDQHSHSDEHHSHSGDQHSHSGEHHSHSGDQHSHSGEHGHHTHSDSHSYSSHNHSQEASHASDHKDSHETEDLSQTLQQVAVDPVAEPVVVATTRQEHYHHHHHDRKPTSRPSGNMDLMNENSFHNHYHHHHQDRHSSASRRNKTVELPKYSDYDVYDFAVCNVQPNRAIPEDQQQNVGGQVTLWQRKTGGPLNIHVKLQGFQMGGHHGNHGAHQAIQQEENNETPQEVIHKHGFHIHSSGDISNGCQSTGPHYNPKNVNHGGPASFARHVGDLGNIECDDNGFTNLVFSDDVASLRGPYSIIGKAIVIHSDQDDFGLGGDDESLKTGNARTRIACCVIEGAEKLPIRTYKAMKLATQYKNY